MNATDTNMIIYNTQDGRASVVLYARDGSVWMNQNQLAELFDTSKPNISMHISNILSENELHQDSVVKNYLTTAADMPLISIGTSLEPDWNLIGTSPRDKHRISKG